MLNGLINAIPILGFGLGVMLFVKVQAWREERRVEKIMEEYFKRYGKS